MCARKILVFLFIVTFTFGADLSSTHHGWKALKLSNGKVEALVVPEVGRVMQFRFIGGENIFWENSALDGKLADPQATEWKNFGGDKTWPSPQADWQKMIGRGWPPPATFDSTPLQGSAKDGAIELVSPVDPAYGIRTHRRISLDKQKPVLRITTTYEKVSGDPVKVGIGVITQLCDPQRAFMIVPAKSKFPEGFVLLNFEKPKDIKFQNGMVSLVRNPKAKSQIGTDASTLLWMNEKYALRIESAYAEGAEYPNQGSSAVIYTNDDPDQYVELETYGPLSTMKAGDKIERTNTYTLSRRTEKDPDAEAKKIVKK